ncbi:MULTISPECIES: GNAT family N-acetyltransferase [Fictibacillus]|jgi:ribosomal protein S18 acetylase RimI-like enzyme|uniref:GNAT family N-acetyltransferase n=1 Tax=Fictibacillus TaxID=1329200 RepID=UPI0018CDE49F|nr:MULTISPECIES: GNAT family N-acetyltransferase [unclassified Fictibacillus]MBH0161526.1 GNAT family N-acetyltransferase [Fictibacillus sp. 26RED30]MBH0172516.1 GNAT family N-acetyltransferase [Fictibacillus sp. 23RED33]
MIHLNLLTEQEFKEYQTFMISDYALEITKNFNLSLQSALEESEMMMKDLWKDGLFTEGQYLYKIKDSKTNEKVGILWYGLIPEINQAYVYHIFIDELYRRKGYGKGTLEKLQSMLKQSGIDSIGLSVFGENEAAYQLYKKLGYKNTRISMEFIL